MTALTLSSYYPDVPFKSSKADHMETCLWGNKAAGEYKRDKNPQWDLPMQTHDPSPASLL